MAKKKILTDNGQEILPITHESCVLDNNGVSIGSKIGNINELATDSRTDLVSAINDILYFNNETKDAKQQLVNLLITNGIYGSTSESWESLINKIQQIKPSGGEIVNNDVVILEDGQYQNTDFHGGLVASDYVKYVEGSHIFVSTTFIPGGTQEIWSHSTFNNPIDFTPFKTLEIKANVTAAKNMNLYLVLGNSASRLDSANYRPTEVSVAATVEIMDMNTRTYTVDLSQLNGTYYCGLATTQIGLYAPASSITITGITLYGDESNEESGGEGGGSGSQYATGTYNYPAQTNMAVNTVISYDLDFTPSVVVAVFNCIKYDSCNIYYMPVTNLCQAMIPAPGDSNAIKLQITDITNKSFTINNSGRTGYIYTDTKVTWYAFGAGSGGSVGGGGLDIISATELPANGKENQICVISDNPVDKFLVSSLDSDFSNLPNDTILLQTKHESTTHNYTVNSGNIISKYYISSCVQEDSIIPSYVYTSGQWVELTPGRLYFVKNKQIITTTEFGDIYRVTPPYVKVESDGIFFYSTETARGTCVTMTNKTNLSAFRNIHIVAKVNAYGASSKNIGVYSSSSVQNRTLGTSSYPPGYVKVSTQTFTSKDYADGGVDYYRQEFDFNITDWTGEYYLGFYFYCNDTNTTRDMYIEEIYFY